MAESTVEDLKRHLAEKARESEANLQQSWLETRTTRQCNIEHNIAILIIIINVWFCLVCTKDRLLATNEEVCTSLENEVKAKEARVVQFEEQLKNKELRIETLYGDIKSLKEVGATN